VQIFLKLSSETAFHQEPRGNNFGSDINPGLIGEQKVYEKLKGEQPERRN